MSKSNVPARKSASTAMVSADIQKQLEDEIAAIQKRIGAPSGDLIKWQPGVGFAAPDGSSGNPLNLVVLDFVSHNLYYDRPYVEGEPGAPACFAIGRETGLLTPSLNSPDKQGDTCGRCVQNEFGSALTGKGKACRNHRVLAVLPVSDEPAVNDDIASLPLWLVKVPPTSIKAFDAFITSLASKRMSHVQVVTQMATDPTSKWANYAFGPTRLLSNDEIMQYMARRDEAKSRLEREPDVSQYTPPPPRPTRTAGARR